MTDQKPVDQMIINKRDNAVFCNLTRCSMASKLAREGTRADQDTFRAETVGSHIGAYRTFLRACERLDIPEADLKKYLGKWPEMQMLKNITKKEVYRASGINLAVRAIG